MLQEIRFAVGNAPPSGPTAARSDSLYQTGGSGLIGERIRAWRRRQGLTQAELAERIPLSQKQVSRLERGTFVQPPRPTLIRVAEVLGEPLVTGEVNRWLALYGYAPVVRPRLPLPPALPQLFPESLPAFCFDAAWNLRALSPLARVLTGDAWEDFNLARYLAGPDPGLAEADRERLLAWVVSTVAWLPADDWVEDFARMVGQAARLSWTELVSRADRLTWPVGYWPGTLAVRLPGEDLSFYPLYVRVPDRPDLHLVALRPDDVRTRRWCDEALAAARPDAPPARTAPDGNVRGIG
jgi:transcriptional regulator with XRE-family HTH domain